MTPTPRPSSFSFAALQSGLLAAVVAVLVWIWAEGESVTSRTESVTVAFPDDQTADEELVLRVEDRSWNGTVRIRFEGSNRATDTAVAMLGRNVRLSPGLPGVPDAPGSHLVVDLREAIAAHPDVKGIGSVVAEVEPRTVLVTAVRMVTRSVPVRVELGREIPLDGDAVTAPESVTLRLPEHLAKELPEPVAAVATVSPDDVARIRGDGPQALVAQVRPPQALAAIEGVTVSPDSVRVAFRVKRTVETATFAAVPVWFALPPTEDGTKWAVRILDKFLTDVTVSGPADAIARLRQGAGAAPGAEGSANGAGGAGSGWVALKALVELSSDDLERAVSSKAVTFPGLPAGLSIAAPSTTVRLQIQRRIDGAEENTAPGPESGLGTP